MVTRIVPGAIQYADYRPGEKGQRECFDIGKAQRVLGYNPQIDIEEGLIRTKEWVKSTLKQSGLK